MCLSGSVTLLLSVLLWQSYTDCTFYFLEYLFLVAYWAYRV